MSKRIAVVISEDPRVTARPVEALRIALGLSAGDHKMTVVLLGNAPLLLREDTEEVMDVDILEKYLPSLKHLSIPFVVEPGTVMDAGANEISVTTLPVVEIRRLVRSVDRCLVF
jgi:hypothetical protein